MRYICLFILSLMLGAVALGGIQSAKAQVQGSILFVAPHRLVIPPSERVAVLNIANRSTEARRYDLEVIDQKMDATGVTQRVDGFDYSAKRMLKFVPRRFSLKPGERQTVRVMVTRPAGLPHGDYHSHLLFREVPLDVKTKEQLTSDRKAEEKGASFEIRTLYGLGVPIVVQHGKLVESLAISEPKLSRTPDGAQRLLSVDFLRSGNAESAGRLSVEYVQPGKEPVPAIDPQWVRIYREVDKISKSFPLTKIPEGAQGGKLIVTLTKSETDDANAIKKEVAFN